MPGIRSQVQKIANALKISTKAFTAATTDIITSAAHGLSNGDRVVPSTTDTLPTGLVVGTVYTVFAATTNTFKLSTEAYPTDQSVDITDTGTGTHTWTEHDVTIPILVEDYQHNILSVHFDATANMTIQIQTSTQEDAPDFSAAKSATNSYDETEIIDLEDGTAIDGDTGKAKAGAADDLQFEVNINHTRWISVKISGWSAGTVTIFHKGADNS